MPDIALNGSLPPLRVQLHFPESSYEEMRARGLEFLVADGRTFPEWGVDWKPYLRDLMCGTDTTSFHHVLVHFVGGLASYEPLSLFGRAGGEAEDDLYYLISNSNSAGMNAYVAEVKLFVDLSGVATI